ncbi:MAG TPA: formate C-acetyltransferase [Polyangiaceae bacterium]|nr:formate C-acetyltransferase [Polyangiaceae bacterium]
MPGAVGSELGLGVANAIHGVSPGAHPAPNLRNSKQCPSEPPAADSEPREWYGFTGQDFRARIDVRAFIRDNATPYEGEADFLAPATQRTRDLWAKLQGAFELERARGVLDVSQIPSSITAHAPGYIDKDLELIVGLQTDAALKRAVFPNGGLRMVEASLSAYGYQIDPELKRIFTKYRKTHNDGVFDAYSRDVLRARSSHIVTGLPDAYGRGRIIGDYRRVPLYGVARLIEQKKRERAALDACPATDSVIRDREELAEQARALGELVEMARSYGFDISRPAASAHEAVQWLYFAYLGAIKEQNGAAMSLGRTSTFLDIYFERDLANGLITETEAQELVDDFVIKLRIVRFLRTPDYNALFSGDPTWVTESIGGMGEDGRTRVTKTSFRFLQTLYNLGPAPEPNLTVLWSPRLPLGFKRFCARVSLDTSSIQYESDELLRCFGGDDTAIACCVSAMQVGKQMQFFGARVNLAKCLLYAINGGRDELTAEQVMAPFEPIRDDVLEYSTVMQRFDVAMEWLAQTYVSAMNCIHYMHDKYAYERLEMALHDYAPLRTMAFGVAGLSVVADSLSAIKYAQVRVLRDNKGLAVDYEVNGEFPKFGNNDDRVDQFAREIVESFMAKLRKHATYRNAVHTQSVLTITSNVVYGKHTGNTPDGRRKGEPFAPGANPLHGRDVLGMVASAFSVSKIPYEHCQDGISLTASVVPNGLGSDVAERESNLVHALDGLFENGLFHINVNVLNRETLLDAMEHPEKYPELTVRVSGYAVNFVKLTREQQQEVVRRTFHGSS